ncbi:MAG: hypothetical protein ACXWKP_15270 [Bradyrhizobium sp.]
MFVSLSNITIEDLESWRETLNLLLITSTLAVCIGVHFEKDGNPHDVQEYGWALVRRGIAVEFALAILLWQLDSVVGTRHKAEIVALEQQLYQVKLPRILDTQECKSALVDAPKRTAMVWYDPAALDARSVAQLFSMCLYVVGWNVQDSPKPVQRVIPARAGSADASQTLLELAGAAPWGITIFTNHEGTMETNVVGQALAKALESVTTVSGTLTFAKAPDALPNDTVRIIIGAKLP